MLIISVRDKNNRWKRNVKKIFSSILVLKWWQVSPIQLELQLAQVHLYTSILGKISNH